jgi:uncharacterized membrane protein
MNTTQVVATSVSLLVLDAIWLQGYLLKPFSAMIKDVQKEPMNVRMTGVIIAYTALLALAIVFLPKTNNYFEAFLLGFCLYAVYDGTNYATLSQWDGSIAIMDSLWGGVLFLLLKIIIDQLK